MKPDFPTPEQVPTLRRLWKIAFGDTEEFLDSFFARAYSPRRCRCVMDGGTVAAALYWFDAACGSRKFAYLYAVATDPAYRNRGLCRALLADTGSLLREQGVQGLLLVPENGDLARMYEKMGFLPCTAVSEFTCTAGDTPAELRQIGAGEYARLRRQFLPPDGVVQEGTALALLESCGALYAGDGWIAAASAEDGKLRCQELLGPSQRAPEILRALDCREGSFRVPGDGQPFSWYLPLVPDCPRPAYFGLALD